MLDSEIRDQFRDGLNQLSFDQRVAVVLRDVEGLSCEEISEITGVQIGTVKSRIARGREHLRSLLQDFKGVERL
jgi:RNA polymerase sigma-70 factor (ECF subfamily)